MFVSSLTKDKTCIKKTCYQEAKYQNLTAVYK